MQVAKQQSPSTPSRTSRGAVVFVLDQSYLIGLKTLLFTLRDAIAEQTHDIIIVSNQEEVGADRFVRNLAHRVIVLSQSDVQRLYAIKQENFERKVENIGTYAALKFFAWSDFGYEYQIFLDVDMICLDRDMRFGELDGDYDFSAVRSFGPGAFDHRAYKVMSPAERVAAAEADMTRVSSTDYKIRVGINSGVFYARSTVLGDHAVEGLIAQASARAYKLEQDAVRDYVAGSPGIRFKSMPLWYNCSEKALLYLAEQSFEPFRNKIKILHFNLAPKPWAKPENVLSWQRKLWWKAYREGQEWINDMSA